MSGIGIAVAREREREASAQRSSGCGQPLRSYVSMNIPRPLKLSRRDHQKRRLAKKKQRSALMLPNTGPGCARVDDSQTAIPSPNRFSDSPVI